MPTLLDAALDHFVSQRSGALANLQAYRTNPAGIGEHGNLVAEVIKLVERAAAADDAVKTLCRLTNRPYVDPFSPNPSQGILPGF